MYCNMDKDSVEYQQSTLIAKPIILKGLLQPWKLKERKEYFDDRFSPISSDILNFMYMVTPNVISK